MQERFQAAIEKLKDTLGSLLENGPLGDMIKAFASFVGDTQKMVKLGNTLNSVFKGIKDTLTTLPGILAAAVEAMKILASLSAFNAVATAAAAAAVTPGVGALLGLAAGAAMYGALTGMMGGLGLGKFNFSAPTEGAMTQPPTSYGTQSQSESTANQSTKTPAINLHANIQVGTEGWGQQTIKSLRQTHATSLQ
jgi:hypothetical protein